MSEPQAYVSAYQNGRQVLQDCHKQNGCWAWRYEGAFGYSAPEVLLLAHLHGDISPSDGNPHLSVPEFYIGWSYGKQDASFSNPDDNGGDDAQHHKNIILATPTQHLRNISEERMLVGLGPLSPYQVPTYYVDTTGILVEYRNWKYSARQTTPFPTEVYACSKQTVAVPATPQSEVKTRTEVKTNRCCIKCKIGRKGCDRAFPTCRRCAQAGHKCAYPPSSGWNCTACEGNPKRLCDRRLPGCGSCRALGEQCRYDGLVTLTESEDQTESYQPGLRGEAEDENAVCLVEMENGFVCGRSDFKGYKGLFRHIRAKHPEKYIPHLPATHEGLMRMVNRVPETLQSRESVTSSQAMNRATAGSPAGYWEGQFLPSGLTPTPLHMHGTPPRSPQSQGSLLPLGPEDHLAEALQSDASRPGQTASYEPHMDKEGGEDNTLDSLLDPILLTQSQEFLLPASPENHLAEGPQLNASLPEQTASIKSHIDMPADEELDPESPINPMSPTLDPDTMLSELAELEASMGSFIPIPCPSCYEHDSHTPDCFLSSQSFVDSLTKPTQYSAAQLQTMTDAIKYRDPEWWQTVPATPEEEEEPEDWDTKVRGMVDIVKKEGVFAQDADLQKVTETGSDVGLLLLWAAKDMASRNEGVSVEVVWEDGDGGDAYVS